MNEVVPLTTSGLPTLTTDAGERAELFNSLHIRKSAHAPGLLPGPPMEFLAWCAASGVPSIVAVAPHPKPALDQALAQLT
jgi:hypothetical protein